MRPVCGWPARRHHSSLVDAVALGDLTCGQICAGYWLWCFTKIAAFFREGPLLLLVHLYTFDSVVQVQVDASDPEDQTNQKLKLRVEQLELQVTTLLSHQPKVGQEVVAEAKSPSKLFKDKLQNNLTKKHLEKDAGYDSDESIWAACAGPQIWFDIQNNSCLSCTLFVSEDIKA